MTHKEQAEQMVNEYRIILMNEDTECGNEILCTSIAVKCALVAVDYLIKDEKSYNNGSFYPSDSWQKVKKEIETYEQ